MQKCHGRKNVCDDGNGNTQIIDPSQESEKHGRDQIKKMLLQKGNAKTSIDYRHADKLIDE